MLFLRVELQESKLEQPRFHTHKTQNTTSIAIIMK